MKKSLISKIKNRALALSLLVGCIVFSLLITEISLRISGFSYHLYLGKVEFGWPDPLIIEDLYKPDKKCFWVPKDYCAKLEESRNHKPTIVFMGDSCTEFGSYHRYLIDLISKEYPNRKVFYANFGVGGWSSYQGLQQLKRDILDIKPKIITIYFGWNDHWLGFGIEDKEVARINSSFLGQYQKLRLVQLFLKARAAFSQYRNKTKDATERISMVDFRNNLCEMIELARANAIIPILLTAPSSHIEGKEPVYLKERWLKDLDDLIPLHQGYISIVRDVAREKEAVLCDLAKEFEALPRAEVANKYFRKDGIHPTEKGDKKIAEFLYYCLKKNNLLIWENR